MKGKSLIVNIIVTLTAIAFMVVMLIMFSSAAYIMINVYNDFILGMVFAALALFGSPIIAGLALYMALPKRV